jgi:hypothetical protein
VATTDQQLSWEARQRPRAAVAAALGGLLAFAGAIYNSSALADAPRPLFVDSLRRVTEDGPIGSMPSTRIPQFEFFHDHLTSVVIGAILLGLSSLAAGGALTYLAYATRARHERFLRIGLYAPFVGGTLTFVGSILTAVASGAYVNDLLDGKRTVDAVSDTSHPVSLYAGQIIVQFGGLTLAAAFVLVALNAMRVGLLTRVFGGIGIFIGVLVVLPVPLLSQVLQPLWLFALAWLFLERWPSGVPPAWRTGRAEPWPSAAQQREAREEQVRGRQRGMARREPVPSAPDADADADADVDELDGDAAPAGKPHPSSKKRKRKRRG